MNKIPAYLLMIFAGVLMMIVVAMSWPFVLRDMFRQFRQFNNEDVNIAVYAAAIAWLAFLFFLTWRLMHQC